MTNSNLLVAFLVISILLIVLTTVLGSSPIAATAAGVVFAKLPLVGWIPIAYAVKAYLVSKALAFAASGFAVYLFFSQKEI